MQRITNNSNTTCQFSDSGVKLGKADRLYTSVLVHIYESCIVLNSEKNKQLNLCISQLFLIFRDGDLNKHWYLIKMLFYTYLLIIVISFDMGFLVRQSLILDHLTSLHYWRSLLQQPGISNTLYVLYYSLTSPCKRI